MKRNPLSVLCLSSLLLYIDLSFARVRIGGGFGKGLSFKPPSTNRGTGITNTGHKGSHGSSSLGGIPKQSGRPSYPVTGRSGGYGAYPGKNINHNPNNRVLSPRYGGSFGYGGRGVRGGSPYSQSVQAMGAYPSDESRDYGQRAVMAAAGGAMAGMALGYGLGRFPRPHFSFHSPQEEYYYNHYMYRKYGVKSTDTNDYSRDYKYTQPPMTYGSFMDSCMKRTDVLPGENPPPKAAAVASALDTGSDAVEAQSSAAPAPGLAKQPDASGDAEDSDTVSIVEIGYPALIEQMKARSCLEMYMVYSDKYLVKARAQRLHTRSQGLLVLLTSALMMLLNSDMLVLLH
ncbi:major prion protein homolog [Betta splendens]|uniref:Major prion protein homolog n=1 Tax=Betta splendens TaxID=158456 RepID=A0A6P7NIV3_BETSP|nr:major prion protein homolog [Betta splendens]XP_029019623.1 major prion protein homolog [Betta splendens]XP_055368132.1 major prion protein homolog [Betta splendens]